MDSSYEWRASGHSSWHANANDLHAASAAIWYAIENASHVKNEYGFRVAKGVRFSVGHAVPVRDVYEEMQDVSDG